MGSSVSGPSCGGGGGAGHGSEEAGVELVASGATKIVFASKKRGDTHPLEGDDSYDIFWGVLEGVRVRR